MGQGYSSSTVNTEHRHSNEHSYRISNTHAETRRCLVARHDTRNIDTTDIPQTQLVVTNIELERLSRNRRSSTATTATTRRIYFGVIILTDDEISTTALEAVLCPHGHGDGSCFGQSTTLYGDYE